eukprot:jgi/Botrbrau1/12991/Bobra.384_1s0016.2
MTQPFRACEASVGWSNRFLQKVSVAGGAGTGAGLLLASLSGAPAARFAVTTAASFSIVMAIFSGVQESVRFLQCQDNVVNSMLGGGVAAFAATRIHGGNPAMARSVALYGGLLGAGGHWWADRHPNWLRGLLYRLDLLDDDGTIGKRNVPPEPTGPIALEDLPPDSLMLPQEQRKGWKRWLPIRKLTPEEAQERRGQEQENFRRRVQLTNEGGLPALVQQQEGASQHNPS